MLEQSWIDNAREAMQGTMIGTLGLEQAEVIFDRVMVRMPYAPALTSLGGAVHSGALMGLAETAAYLAALNQMDDVQPMLARSSLTCLAPATTDVVAEARVLLFDARRAIVDVIMRSELTPIAVVQSEFRLARATG